MALIVAGCVGESGHELQPAEADHGEAEAAAGRWKETTFEATGRTGTYGCVYLVEPSSCTNFTGADNDLLELPYVVAPQNLRAEFTWDASDAFGTELSVTLLRKNGTQWAHEPPLPVARGPSPLAIDWDLSLVSGERFALYVKGAGETELGPGVGADVVTGQEFSVSGTVASIAPAGQ